MPATWVRARPRHVGACGAAKFVRSFDLMEFNPAHDTDSRTARVAVHLFLTFLSGFAAR